MISERSVVMYLVLSLLVPFFMLYWFYVIANDIKEAKGDDSPNGVLHIILGLVTCGLFFCLLIFSPEKSRTPLFKACSREIGAVSSLIFPELGWESSLEEGVSFCPSFSRRTFFKHDLQ